MQVASGNVFGERLKELREAAGLTVYALAKKSTISKQALGKLEKGESEPTWSTVQKLAAALGTTVLAFDVKPPRGVADQGDDEPEADEPSAPKRRPKK